MFHMTMVKNSILLFLMVTALGFLTSCTKTDLSTPPEIINELSLPGKNPYIAENLSLRKTSKVPTPRLGYEKNGISLWYEDENEFELPKATLNIRLYSAQAYSSDAHYITLRLHSQIMKDLLSAESYNAAQAGLYYYISSSVRSYNIGIQGYNDKINVFLEKVLTVFNPSVVDEKVFNRIKQNYLQDLQNGNMARPINQIFAAVSVEGNPVSLSRDAQIKALSDLTYANFLSIAQDLQSSMEIEGIFNGNVTQSDVNSIGSMLSDRLKPSLNPNNKLTFTETIIPEGLERFREISVDHNDSALFAMIQGDNDTDKETALYKLIVHMLRQRFYKSLRTDQQLGYIVQLSDYSYDRIPAMSFAIQSPKVHPATLVERIDTFLIEQKDYFATLSAEEFAKNKDGLLSNINKSYDNVYTKGNGLNRQIINGELSFDNRKRRTQAINQITLDELRTFYNKEITDTSRRWAAIWSIGQSHKNQPDYDPSKYDLCFKPKCISKTTF